MARVTEDGRPIEERDPRENPSSAPIPRAIEDDDSGDESIDSDMSEADVRVAELMDREATPEELAPAVEEQEAPDAADTLEALTSEESAEVVKHMEEESAAEALAHMDHALAATVLVDLGPAEAAELLQIMEPDDAADLLQSMGKEQAAQTLRHMPTPLAAKLGKLAQYEPESAGGLMTTSYVWVPAHLTVAQTIEHLRTDELFTQSDTHGMYVYVVDIGMRLAGVLELRRLLTARASEKVADIMIRDVDTIGPDLDQEDVAREFERYDYLSLPVVDLDNRLLGIVTIDDVVDIIQEEQTEDVQLSVGAGAGESVNSTVREKFRGRMPWLAINLLTSQLAASVVIGFRPLVEHYEILAALMGVVANQAGNAGQQSLAVTLRGIALGEVRPGKAAGLISREVSVGILTGLTVGALLLTFGWAVGATGLIRQFNWRLGAVGGVSMVFALSVGCFVGSALPLLLTRFKRDPATGSTIFLTMVTDTSAFVTFLGLAYVLQAWVFAG